jgi:hypothetical protein
MSLFIFMHLSPTNRFELADFSVICKCMLLDANLPCLYISDNTVACRPAARRRP